MAIDIEHLKHFQSEQLEQKNIQTSARIPIHTRTIEWALIEIVILLTGINDSLKRMTDGGMEVVTIPPAMMKDFQAKTAPLQEAFLKRVPASEKPVKAFLAEVKRSS